tara:strand:- start:43 stop:468 length:426 start_codon:yes stop_codon:yes gene_type:complete
MNFRNITYSDYEQYKTLINSSISYDYLKHFIDTILNDNHVIIILEMYNKIIGTGTLFIEDKLTHGGCRMGHIENILIHSEYRKKGLGVHLMKYLLHLAKINLCYRVDLNCSDELESFYKKNGFNKKYLCMNILFKENFKML